MDKNYYGIDLGTTNSAITSFDGNEIRVFKSKDQSEVTPSVVHISKSGALRVGRKAYNALILDPENTICEFKRWMGRPNKMLFKNVNKSMNAEQLSAEILKSLLEDVNRQTGENIESAVITVPIEFGQLQCEETVKAGEDAGLKSVYLLQEPIAASVAYGYKEDKSNKVWLVYDFGGGTFDAAVVSTYNNKLTVVGHAGDNLLGGKDFDSDIVDKILIPKIEEAYSIKNYDKSTLRRKLSHIAEGGKIDLSYSDKAIMSVCDIGEDDNGEDIELEVEITKNIFDKLISEYVIKTITICNNALYESRIAKNKLDSIILVGGTTFIPLIREKIEEEYHVPLKYSIDPMTVVAMGASIFSLAKQRDNEDLVEHSSNVNSDSYQEIIINLAYEATSADIETLIMGKVKNYEEYGRLEVNIENINGLWSGGWKAVNNGEFEITAFLQEKKRSDFKITFRDEKGKILKCNIETFSIVHIGINYDNPPLPHSIGVEIYDDKRDKNILDVIFKSSITRLPCEKEVTYKASKTLKPSDYGDAIEFLILEGEKEEPNLNDIAGKISIKAEDIRRPILENDDITLNIKINESRKIMVDGRIVRTNEFFTRDVYIPEEKSIDEELNENLDKLWNDYEKVSSDVDYELFDKNPNYIEEMCEKINDIDFQVNTEKNINDINRKQKINRTIKDMRIEINNTINQKPQNNKLNSTINEVLNSQQEVNDIVNKDGNEDEKFKMAKLNEKVDRNIKGGNERLLRKTNDDLWNLGYSILVKKFDFWEYWFNTYKATPQYNIYDICKFNELVNTGEKAVALKDLEALSCVVRELANLIKVDNIDNLQSNIKSGLKKM